MAYYIYALFCDKTDDIVYVGQTENPYSRLLKHKSSCKKDLRPLYEYFRENKSVPRLEIVEIIYAQYRTQRVKESEKFWINALYQFGYNIKNVVSINR